MVELQELERTQEGQALSLEESSHKVVGLRIRKSYLA